MLPPKGPAALAIMIGKGKPAPSGASPAGAPDADDQNSQDLEMAARDLIGAIKAGDAGGVAEAFKSMTTICGSKE